MANSTDSDLETVFQVELFQRYDVKKYAWLLKEKYNKNVTDMAVINTSGKILFGVYAH